MANETTNLKLTKPLANEFYDINVFNDNFDKIDKELFDPSVTENTSYATENGVKEFECKNGYVDNIVIEGQTKILNAENIEVEAGTDGAKLVSVGQGDKIEVLTQNSDETKQDKKQILTTLRSLPNGVKDTIEKRGNKYVKVQRCGEIVLDGNESDDKIVVGLETDNTYRFGFYLDNLDGSPHELICISDRFSSECNHNWMNDKEQVDQDPISLNIRILKSKLTENSKTAIKDWLKLNPVTMVYKLATPIIEELPNFNPQAFSDKTTLLLNSGVVQGEVSFEVTNSLGSELEVLKGKVSDLDTIYPNDMYKPTLLNGWASVNDNYPLLFIKEGDVVHIMGRIGKGLTTSNTIICKIPTSCVPKVNINTMFYVGSTGTLNGVGCVLENGNFVIAGCSNNEDVYFNSSYYIK